MFARSAAALIAGVVLALGGCGGSSTEAFRIGILSDCYGPSSTFHELIVASAELPLIERGGKLSGRRPSDGIESASVAGHRVELLVGCVTGTGTVIPEARRLVEELGAQVLVGPLLPQYGLILRDYARRHPEVAFLIQPSGAPELTLTNPAANVVRFASDNAQSGAGLGSYAYHELGWRTAATVAVDLPYGWGSVAGFVAEFCALGGRIRVADRRWFPPRTDGSRVARGIPDSVDGVFLGGALVSMQGFVKRYSAHHRDVSRRLLAYNALTAGATPDIAVGGRLPLEPTANMQAYVAAFAKAFPDLPPEGSLEPRAFSYRDGVEAALQALERAGGAQLTAALAQIELDSPAGRIRLDANRQAIAPSYISQMGKPSPSTLSVLKDVEQTFGGYFKPGDPPPTRATPACRKGVPPPWAR